jgi:ankyrin repeat protein
MSKKIIKRFHKLVHLNDTDKVTLMIKQDPSLARSIHDGVKPIHIAIQFGQLDMLETLLQFDKNLAKEQTGSRKGLPLSLAVKYNQMEIFNMLISCLGRSAVLDQLDARNKYHYTAMHYAAITGNVTMIEKLVELGSTAHMVDPIYKWSAMH